MWLLITAGALFFVNTGGILNDRLEPRNDRTEKLGLLLDAAGVVLTVLIIAQILL